MSRLPFTFAPPEPPAETWPVWDVIAVLVVAWALFCGVLGGMLGAFLIWLY